MWRDGSACVCTLDKTITIQIQSATMNGSSSSTSTGWKNATIVIARSSESVNVVKGDFENKVTSATKQWSNGPIDGKWYEYLGIQ